ncbi:uncharacterized protein MYCFIDRAFT_64154 [Pseudocercospora fijiensis CIRAD86]|uniref:Uncharacterized protein n=1 Tax=Pseudocercospora fijiensis (strain CIRAD86) TaxID=383855 RepID=M3ADM5_PSEFD|nr:uncharacterized protein MYCFIDRAFT_64154 [Pseudocercospora fijiensis CIRAD86]EME82646.1 hypothetical protein MYCFIDRAFT_64154 [Pseudocercospora fijiensis CIRAD86]
MTRRIVYGISLWVFLGAAACTIAAIALPNWVSYTSPTDHDPIRVTYGLHKRCSSITGGCTKFPQYEDCRGDDKSFCSMWRSTGFFMNFAVVLELASIIAYITILVGGRSTREAGWKIISPLLSIVGLTQLIPMALVAGLYENDSRFFVGWALDKSWILCTVSWIVLTINAVGVASAACILPYDDDYEPIS